MKIVRRDRLSGLRVLVVEDVATVRHATRRLLELDGAIVAEASTGGEAVDLAGTQTFDIAVTDLGLPDMLGEAVIARIRSVSQGRTRIAVLSGAHRDDLAHALHVGADRAFAKPLNWDDLVSYLARQTRAAAA